MLRPTDRARGPSRRAFLAIVPCAIGIAATGCKRPFRVGDYVLVAFDDRDYPAYVIGVEGPSRFRVRYEGLGPDWDETIAGTRIRRRLPGPPAPGASAPPLPARLRPHGRASGSASVPAGIFKVGDRVRVEWHGSVYPATILAVLGDERYRVHYEGLGPEWDENVPIARIQRR